jgi:opine dehydrogenase
VKPNLINVVAILGAGNGGCAAAADLTLRGYEVRLHARRQESLEPIRQKGGLDVTGGVHEGFARFDGLTASVGEAVEGADLIMIVVPANGLAYYAKELAPILSSGAKIFLNPGQTGGGLHFVHELRRAGYDDEVHTCETSIITQVSRLQTPTHVHIPGYIRGDWAAYPSAHSDTLFEMIHSLYPLLRRANDVLETGFANLNALVHPTGMVMNAGWIEHTAGDFYFYREGFTESIGRVAESIDRERMQIADSLGVHTRTMLEISRDMGFIGDADLQKGNVSEAWRGSTLPAGIRSPTTLMDRYILEDVSYGLVPISEFGRLMNVPTLTIDAVIHLSSLATGVPLREVGLTLERMGLADVQVEDLHGILRRGKTNPSR